MITSKPANGTVAQDKICCTLPADDLASISLVRCRPGRQGDRARGISAERFEIPLAGGVAAPMGASAVGWRPACAAWGEPARPGMGV